MITAPLNAVQTGIIIDKLHEKENDGTITDVELLLLDLYLRVDYLENENKKLRKFCKRR